MNGERPFDWMLSDENLHEAQNLQQMNPNALTSIVYNKSNTSAAPSQARSVSLQPISLSTNEVENGLKRSQPTNSSIQMDSTILTPNTACSIPIQENAPQEPLLPDPSRVDEPIEEKPKPEVTGDEKVEEAAIKEKDIEPEKKPRIERKAIQSEHFESIDPNSDAKADANPGYYTDPESGDRWIRCDNPFCRKWRYLPEEVAFPRQPWFCVLNAWDEAVSSCNYPQLDEPGVICPRKEETDVSWYPTPVDHFEKYVIHGVNE